MKKIKIDWKLELIKDLRKKRFKARLLAFIEVVYHTIIPIFWTSLIFTTGNILYLIPIIFIIAFRLRITNNFIK